MSSTDAKDMEKEILKSRKREYGKLVHLLQRFLDFERFGFQRSFAFISPEHLPYVIYDSEVCRVKFSLEGGDMHGSMEMTILYGRRHASSHESFITWQGERCWCWHHVFDTLDFLDGLSPQEAVDRVRVKDRWPPPAEEFRQSEIAKKLIRDNYPEWMTRMHAAIWKYYGQRLFGVFDLRRPDLWQQYTEFVREVQHIKAFKPFKTNSIPAADKIC